MIPIKSDWTEGRLDRRPERKPHSWAGIRTRKGKCKKSKVRFQTGNGFDGEEMSCQDDDDDDVVQDTGRYTGDGAGKRITDFHMPERRVDRGGCV